MMVPAHLAAPASSASSTTDLMVWIAVLIVVVLVGGWLIMVLRRRLYQRDSAGPAGASFQLDDLRKMHDAGQLTDDQYRRARDQIIAATTALACESRPDSASRDNLSPRQASELQDNSSAPGPSQDNADTLPDHAADQPSD